jgi:hypothetical protein
MSYEGGDEEDSGTLFESDITTRGNLELLVA